MKTDNGKDRQSNKPKSSEVEGDHGLAKDPEPEPSVHTAEIDKNEEFVRMADESNVEAGERLLRLREAKAYKIRGYKSHGEHVECLGLTRSRASQLERAARLLRKLKEIAEEGEELPKSEGLLRALLKYVKPHSSDIADEEATSALEVWREAVEAGEATSRGLRKRVDEKMGVERKGGVPVTEIEAADLKDEHEMEAEIAHAGTAPSDDDGLPPETSYRDAATYANKSLKMFGDFKASPTVDKAFDIECRLRAMVRYFDALDQTGEEEAA